MCYEVSENASEQVFVVFAHFGGFMDGVLSVAQEVERTVVERLIVLLREGLRQKEMSVWPKKEAVFSMMLRRALKWKV